MKRKIFIIEKRQDHIKHTDVYKLVVYFSINLIVQTFSLLNANTKLDLFYLYDLPEIEHQSYLYFF